eukprot:g4259.t1
MSAQTPLCCELTNRSFMQLLARIARELGFEVKRWPVRGPETCMALTRAARDGHISDCSAMLLHAWHGSYDKECVPSWDFYPLLKALKERSVVLYSSPELDEVHSAKRYRSEFMAPTQFLTLTRKAHGIHKDTCSAQELLREAELNGLTTENLMLKQGFSWGGAQVTRLRPFEVLEFLRKRVIPKIPPQAKALTILLQAKVDLVAELRWMVLEGQLRGRGWVTLPVPRVGRRANSGCYKNEAIRPKVEQVVQEATRDAGGQVPQYLRVDFLVDKQGRAWLGERESWGADLVRNQVNPLGRTNPTRAELARAMLSPLRWHCVVSEADSYCETTISMQFKGKKRWRIQAFPEIRHHFNATAFGDEQIYGHRQHVPWTPETEFTVGPGQCFVFPTGYLHETFVDPDGNDQKCYTASTYQFNHPRQVNLYRAFMSILAAGRRKFPLRSWIGRAQGRFSMAHYGLGEPCLEKIESYATLLQEPKRFLAAPDQEQMTAQAREVMKMADGNKDGVLTREELPETEEPRG